MPTNSELIAAARMALNDMIVGKSEGGSLNLTETHFNHLIPREQVDALIDLTQDHSAFLSSINTVTRQQKKGTVPIYDLTGEVMEHVGEQDPTAVHTRSTTTTVPYVTQKHKCEITISHEEIEESKAVPGLGDMETKAVETFLKQLGNNVSDVAINGNTAFAAAPVDRRQRMLKGVDGVDVLTQAGSNVVHNNGKAFAKEVFDAMYDAIPWRYRRNTDALRWWLNSRTINNWKKALVALGAGSILADRALTEKEAPGPSGIAPWIVPYVGENDGPTAIAPTSVADNTTTLQAVLTTLVTATNPINAAAGVGRRFKITCKTTGHSEVCTGILDTTLRINTVGLLGQTAGSVSTTNTDYEVTTFDETSIYLGDPKAITLVWNGEWRSNREWNPKLDQAEITIYLEFCVSMPVLDAIVKYTNIATPPITW